MKSLILQNWQAKTVSFVLALVLWMVIKKSIEATTLPSRIQFEPQKQNFQFEISRDAKKTGK
jgi:hypothetical protein